MPILTSIFTFLMAEKNVTSNPTPAVANLISSIRRNLNVLLCYHNVSLITRSNIYQRSLQLTHHRNPVLFKRSSRYGMNEEQLMGPSMSARPSHFSQQ
jgi:hypothetical protein